MHILPTTHIKKGSTRADVYKKTNIDKKTYQNGLDQLQRWQIGPLHVIQKQHQRMLRRGKHAQKAKNTVHESKLTLIGRHLLREKSASRVRYDSC